jgi:hypothetical protein
VAARYDNKIALRLPDLGSFYHEWAIDDLPWKAIPTLASPESLQETIDQSLVEAISDQALPSHVHSNPQAKAATVAFLYLYMTMGLNERRYACAICCKLALLTKASQSELNLDNSIQSSCWCWTRFIGGVLGMHGDRSPPST